MSNPVSQYLSMLPKVEREALETIRKQILSLMPEAEERLSRGVPFFYYEGKRAVGFRSSKTHLSFFIMEGKVFDIYRSEISSYDNSSTVIKFSPEKPLNEGIIEKLVRARMEEIKKSLIKKKMLIKTHVFNDIKIAEVSSEDTIINNVEDGVDLLGNLYYQGFDRIIIHQTNITSAFFDLKSGMAGEILQKFSTYRVPLAIVGDFSKLPSKSLHDFIYESNKGRQIIFVSSTEEALKGLSY